MRHPWLQADHLMVLGLAAPILSGTALLKPPVTTSDTLSWLTAPSSRSRADDHPPKQVATGRTGGAEKRDVSSPVAGRRFALRMSEPVPESRRVG